MKGDAPLTTTDLWFILGVSLAFVAFVCAGFRGAFWFIFALAAAFALGRGSHPDRRSDV